MSFRRLLVHRVSVYRLTDSASEGVASYSWGDPIATDVPCRVDLDFIRKGRDPSFVPESGRQGDRTGVAFFMPDAPVQPGDRITITSTGGITGSFVLDATLDQTVQRHDKVHHLEAHVTEVAKSLGAT